MKLPVEWLKDITTINIDETALLEGIPANGLEVEGVTKTGAGKQNIVVAEIKEIKKHPEADKLFVTKVDCGNFGTKQIVTNLSQVKTGDKLLVALEGVKLSNGLEIKNAKLKGVDSEGMFIGWEEIGFEYKSDDPIFMDNETKNGAFYYDILPFNDTIIDIELTSNRGDCLGIKGLATDIKARFNADLKNISTEYKTEQFKVDEFIKAEIKTDSCLRYCGAVIKDINIKPSPLWMQMRLIKVGIRPINNVVDITNFVLYEMNQPLHAFDLDKISGKKIIIRDAKDDEKMVTLDNVERVLQKQDIVISDEDRACCLGGVMGGQVSEVSETTKNIFLESAYFKPVNIRKCSRRLGLRSESSYRFERDIDRANVDSALKRALYYFDLLKVGKIATGIIDIYPVKYEDRFVDTTVTWLNNKLGSFISKDEIINILTRLQFEAASDGDNLKIKIPSNRNDVNIKEDIAEEVARIYGYNKIKPTLMRGAHAGVRSQLQKRVRKIHNLLIESGCNEVMNFSFIGKSLFDKMGLDTTHRYRNNVMLEVPLTDDWAGMRSSLIPGLLRTVSFNMARQNKSLSLYEVGNISIPSNSTLPDEYRSFGVALAGNKTEKSFCQEAVKYDFFDLKGIIDNIFDSFGIVAEYKVSKETFLHPYQQAEIFINGKNAGLLGKLHPVIADKFDIDNAVYIAEVNISVLFENVNDTIIFSEVPKFPSSERDIALILSDEINSVSIINQIKALNIGILKDINIFDIYRGDRIENGCYSIAIKLQFNKVVSTLTDSEVEAATRTILDSLNTKFGAKLR